MTIIIAADWRRIHFARDLVNAAAERPFSCELRGNVLQRWSELGGTVEVLGEAEMKKAWHVGIAGCWMSESEPRRANCVVHALELRGKDGDKTGLACGKGACTFDSGGISLKLGANMWTLKGGDYWAAPLLVSGT